MIHTAISSLVRHPWQMFVLSNIPSCAPSGNDRSCRSEVDTRITCNLLERTISMHTYNSSCEVLWDPLPTGHGGRQQKGGDKRLRSRSDEGMCDGRKAITGSSTKHDVLYIFRKEMKIVFQTRSKSEWYDENGASYCGCKVTTLQNLSFSILHLSGRLWHHTKAASRNIRFQEELRSSMQNWP